MYSVIESNVDNTVATYYVQYLIGQKCIIFYILRSRTIQHVLFLTVCRICLQEQS